ncbi:MAG: hypothetical protein OXL96_20800 [Candidatus Poribacteria bacterium]|nr:hypothetical protein [Candidatus Poribacteria bacterium]
MFALILKELRCYTNIGKYRRMQLVVLCGFALLLLVGTIEFYAYHTPNVGKQTYKLCIIFLLIVQFWVPRHAVEAWHTDHHLPGNGTNGALLALSPLASWKILAGKLSAIVLWAMWGIWLTFPLFALSSYTGGFAVSQLVRCGAVLLVSCIFFALIGIGFALRNPPLQAKSISYGLVLLLTFLPLIPIPLFEAIPVLDVISPLCVVLSILSADPTYLWLWNIGLLCVVSVLMFPVLVKQMRL